MPRAKPPADEEPAEKPERRDLSGLSIVDLLTQLQRKTYEELLYRVENDLATDKDLAIIARLLMENGFMLVRTPEEQRMIDITPKIELPDYTGQDYDK